MLLNEWIMHQSFKLCIILVIFQNFYHAKGWECGKQETSPIFNRIINGEDATPNSWPWMASMRVYKYNGQMSKTFCAGTLINSEYVITAAHCLLAYPDSKLAVILGSFNNNNFNSTNIYNVSSYGYNKNYSSENVQFGYDIGYLKLSRPVQFSESISPICVPGINGPIEDVMNLTVVVAGWWA